MLQNIQIRNQQKFYLDFFSWIPAGAPPQYVVCVGIALNDVLLFPVVTVVNDIPQFLG
jgi:hypothetical protein